MATPKAKSPARRERAATRHEPQAPKETPTIWDRLAEPFNPSCVEWKPGVMAKDKTSALAMAYIDARSVMARLDEVVGPANWQDSYHTEGGRTICTIQLRVQHPDGSYEWIGKSDGSGDSQVEAEKGGISGAFKRAAVKWGIGRYLYDVDSIWAGCITRPGKGDTVLFKDWSDAGYRTLAEALNRAPGARITGKPPGVEMMIEQLEAAETLDELRRVYETHWPAMPIEYRREVLETKDRRRLEIEASNATEKEGTK